MGLKESITRIAREEANTAFREYFAIHSQKTQSCQNVAVIQSIDLATGTADVLLPDGTIKTVYPTGNIALNVGTYVQLSGEFIVS